MRLTLSRSLLLALPLAACGGRSSGSGPPAVTPAALSLEPQIEPLDEAQRHHLLRRTCWGAAPNDVARLATLGLPAFVDDLLHPQPEPQVEAAAGRLIGYRTFPSPREMATWWTELMVHSAHPLRDVMAFFWHAHFATSVLGFDTGSRYLLLEQIETLRATGLGNVRTLLHAMTADPAMLIWLDAVASTAQAPNENLAREFFELFTLGVDNGYTQADVVEAARALTGYRRVDRQNGQAAVEFDATRHDDGTKTIFGVSGRFGRTELVDLTLDQRPVAEYLCRRLFEHFCYAPAPAAVVAQLAALLRQNLYELRPVLAVLLRSRAFFSTASQHSHIKSPLEAGIGLLRATGLAFPPTSLDHFLDAMGQRPCMPPSVAGWPSDEAWLTASSVLGRRNLLRAIAIARDYQSTNGEAIETLLPPPDERSPGRVVGALADRLGVSLSADDTASYVAYLNSRTVNTNGALEITPDEFQGLYHQHISERVRGLLFVLTQHPSYFLR